MAGLAIVLSHVQKSLQWAWFAEELRARGIEHCFIVVEPARSPFTADLEGLGCPVFRLSARGSTGHLANVLECRRILQRRRPQVLHTSLPHGNLVGQLAGWLAGVPYRVTTCENASWAQDYGSRKHAAIDRLTYRLAHRVVALTSVAAGYLERTYGVAPGKLAVIPHAGKPSAFEDIDAGRIDEVRQRLGVREGEFTVGMVARMERWKGHRYAIEAVGKLVAQRPNVRLVVLGLGGEAEHDVRTLVRDLDLGRFVRLAGFVEDTLAAYRVFDVHLHVPINPLVETGGITLIEGMLSGCAQVLTRSGFAADSAQHMENAWVVDYQSASGIADALVQLHDRPELRRRLGAAARLQALRLFDFEQKVERTLDVYGVEAWRNRAQPPISRL